MQINTDVLKKAGLTKGDTAKLFGVSRTTVHNWFNGLSVHPLIKDRVKAMQDQIEEATIAGSLPVPPQDSSDERVALVKKALGFVA